MLLTEYLFDLIKAIDEYSKSGYILTSELNIDARSEKIGLIKGSVIFNTLFDLLRLFSLFL